jgi:integrase
MWPTLSSRTNGSPHARAPLYTGCRDSELLRLRWSDIDFEQALSAVR